MSAKRVTPPMNFKTLAVPEVPQGRNGKHKLIVTRILSDLDRVEDGMAIKIPLIDLAERARPERLGQQPNAIAAQDKRSEEKEVVGDNKGGGAL